MWKKVSQYLYLAMRNSILCDFITRVKPCPCPYKLFKSNQKLKFIWKTSDIYNKLQNSYWNKNSQIWYFYDNLNYKYQLTNFIGSIKMNYKITIWFNFKLLLIYAIKLSFICQNLYLKFKYVWFKLV